MAEAETVLEAALKTDPSDGSLWNVLGIIRAQQQDSGAAEAAFLKAVRMSPGLETAWLNLGRVYQLRGTADSMGKGIAAYANVLRLDPGSAEAHHQLALLFELTGRFQESLAHLDRLPPQDRSRRQALAIRCADEAALGKNAAALGTADRLLRDSELEEDDVVAILGVVGTGDDAVVLRLLEGLDARRLATGRTLVQLAPLFERAANLKAAREVYERIAQASPGSAPPLLDLARVAWKQKDYEGTLSYLAHARDLEPDNASIHFFFGLACNEMNLPGDAKKSLEKALELAPDNPYYNYAMGAVELQWAEKVRAIQYLKHFTALRPADARGHLALATAYFGQDQYQEAKAELALPLNDAQLQASAEYLSGRISVQQNDLPGAIAHFRRLLTLQPKSVEGHAELGSALLEREDAAGARAETETALRLEPDNYLANRTLLRLYRLAGDPRLKEQTERLQHLIESKDARLRMLQRTIEVRPW